MASITDFKAKLSGARANQFKVTMPMGYAQVGGEIEELAFLCKATNLPEMTIGTVEVPLDRVIKIGGDRTIGEWSITVFNDTNFKLRNAFERWQNGINNMSDNEGLTNPADYQVDALLTNLTETVQQLKVIH